MIKDALDFLKEKLNAQADCELMKVPPKYDRQAFATMENAGAQIGWPRPFPAVDTVTEHTLELEFLDTPFGLFKAGYAAVTNTLYWREAEETERPVE